MCSRPFRPLGFPIYVARRPAAPFPRRYPLRLNLDHSHCPVLAPATLAALPSTRAIPNRDVFYVADPISSIRRFSSPNSRLSRSEGRRVLLPRINKDFPALYAFQFQDAVLGPRIVLQFLSDFIFIFGVEDQQRAALINQRPAHQNESVIDELIDEPCVLVPKGLFTGFLGEISIRTGRRNCQECTFHDKANFKRPRVASTFRLVRDPQHHFSTGVMRCGLLLRRDRFAQRQDLRHHWFDFPSVNQLRDFC
jgi:hypothetical protein